MENTKAFNRITNLTSSYFEGEAELVKRVTFVKTVIRNTLNKFPSSVWPEELSWVRVGWNSRITGFQFRDSNGKPVTMTGENPATIGHGHTLTFYIIGSTGWNSDKLTVTQASIPASLLFNDPMAIAQYARKLIREKQNRLRTEELQKNAEKLREVEKQMEALKAEIQNLNEKDAETRMKMKTAREADKRNQEKKQRRKAAKLLNADS